MAKYSIFYLNESTGAFDLQKSFESLKEAKDAYNEKYTGYIKSGDRILKRYERKADYVAFLVNGQNCTFDKDEFDYLSDVKRWARGRGSDYTLYVKDETCDNYNEYIYEEYFK